MRTAVTRVHVSQARSGTAIVAALALLVAGAAAVALDVVAPGAGPLVQPISSAAHTPHTWLWRLTVGAAATALVLLASTFRNRATAPIFIRALLLAGVGFAAAGLFAADLWFPWERPPTLVGGVHVAAVLLVLVAFSVAMASRAGSVPPEVGGRWCRVAEVFYGVSLLGALVYVGASAVAGRPPLLFGLWERLALASALAWSGGLTVGALRADPTGSSRLSAGAG